MTNTRETIQHSSVFTVLIGVALATMIAGTASADDFKRINGPELSSFMTSYTFLREKRDSSPAAIIDVEKDGTVKFRYQRDGAKEYVEDGFWTIKGDTFCVALNSTKGEWACVEILVEGSRYKSVGPQRTSTGILKPR